MIFSLSYLSPYKEEAMEISCPYNQLGVLFKFIQEHPNKRYRITTEEVKEVENLEKLIEQVKLVKEVTPYYTVCCDSMSIFQAVKDAGLNAYVHLGVTDWDTYVELVNSGVSDIIIDGPLGFQVDNIKKFKENIAIRVHPNFSSTRITHAEHANFFFIRPEDLPLYEDMIDIIEFAAVNPVQEATLYEIYKRGFYNFELKNLIPQLNHTINNTFIRPDFCQHRLNCGQRCKVPDGRACKMCDTELRISSKVIDYFRARERLEKKQNL